MKKTVRDNIAYYEVAWSRRHKYDKYDALKILPELAGILWFDEKTSKGEIPVLVYACWRDGLRVGMRRIMDQLYTPWRGLTTGLEAAHELYYKYTAVDSTPEDMKDIIFRLIKNYSPRLNTPEFSHSGRYDDIFVKESEMPEGQVVEKFAVY